MPAICTILIPPISIRSSEGPQTWSLDNIALVVCFVLQIPIQLWAITVVKSCYDFFVLLFVFVSLAEK